MKFFDFLKRLNENPSDPHWTLGRCISAVIVLCVFGLLCFFYAPKIGDYSKNGIVHYGPDGAFYVEKTEPTIKPIVKRNLIKVMPDGTLWQVY